MADKKVHVFCDDDCKYEGMTKEQIEEALTPFPVNLYMKMPDAVMACDKTYAEIKAAVLAGKEISVTYGDSAIYRLLAAQVPGGESSTSPFLFVGFRVSVGTSSATYYRDTFILDSDDNLTQKISSWNS